MAKPTVACIGDLLVEIMRPEVGDTLAEPGVFLGPYPSGASGIFIDTIARLGLSARFIGAVGDDDFGRLITGRLQKDGVDISRIRVLGEVATAVAFVTYFHDGSRQFIFHLADAATGRLFPEDVDAGYLDGVEYLHVIGSTLSTNENCREACLRAIDCTLGGGGKISFDPNFRPELIEADAARALFAPVIVRSSIVSPTEEELKVLTGEADFDAACDALLSVGPEILAVKQGQRGSTVVTAGRKHHVPAFDVDEVDPTGAGDSYCAGFLYGLLTDKTLEESARFANAVAALSITKKGPMEGVPRLAEVNVFINKHV